MQAADRQVNRCSPSAGERTAADRIAGTTSRAQRRSPQPAPAPAQARETASRAGRSGRSRGGRRRHPGRGALRGRRGRTSPAAPRPKTAPQPLKTAARPRPTPPVRPAATRRHTKTPAPEYPERGSFVAGGRSARGVTSPPRTRRPRAAAWRRPAPHRHPAGPHPRPGRLRHPARPAAGRRCPAKRPAMRH